MVPDNNPAAEATNVASKTASEATRVASKAGEEMASQMAKAANAYGGALGASFQAVQEYQAKLVQFFQANAEANLHFGQKVMQSKSPSDFVEAMTSHMRERAAMIGEQAKELASLGQEASRKAMEQLSQQTKK